MHRPAIYLDRHPARARTRRPDLGDRRVSIITALERGNFELDTGLVRAPSNGRIRCPHCRWQPERGSRWLCYPAGAPEFFFGGCGASWNTFDTRGRCPGCSHQWRFTSCLACSKWALHDDWYEPEPGKDAGGG